MNRKWHEQKVRLSQIMYQQNYKMTQYIHVCTHSNVDYMKKDN